MVPALGQAGLENPFEDAAEDGADADVDADDDADGDRDAEVADDPEADDGNGVLADVLRDGVVAIVDD